MPIQMGVCPNDKQPVSNGDPAATPPVPPDNFCAHCMMGIQHSGIAGRWPDVVPTGSPAAPLTINMGDPTHPPIVPGGGQPPWIVVTPPAPPPGMPFGTKGKIAAVVVGVGLLVGGLIWNAHRAEADPKRPVAPTGDAGNTGDSTPATGDGQSASDTPTASPPPAAFWRVGQPPPPGYRRIETTTISLPGPDGGGTFPVTAVPTPYLPDVVFDNLDGGSGYLLCNPLPRPTHSPTGGYTYDLTGCLVHQ